MLTTRDPQRDTRNSKAGVAGRLLLLLFLVLGCGGEVLTTEQEAGLMAEKAAAYLWNQQGNDGGWHSETHGLLKSGQALTPFVLHQLLMFDEDAPEQSVNAGLQFLRSHLNDEGVLGLANAHLVEYPNYATSYALRVFEHVGLPEDSSRIQGIVSYLLHQQFDEQRALSADHAAYGGWGFGETNLPAGQAGYVDLSHTRRVLEALKAIRLASSNKEKVIGFLGRLQNQPFTGTRQDSLYDGGFHYSSVVQRANKGKTVHVDENPVFLSYATATCDGVLAYHALGLGGESPYVRDALAWLDQHRKLQYPEGIPHDDPGQWHRVMFFYHLSVRAAVYDVYGWPAGDKEMMLSLLKAEIKADGSFLNEAGAPNKENDPLLATALALAALTKIASTQ